MITFGLFRNLKLRTKLLLLYLFTILLPLILLSQVVIYLSGEKIINQTTQLSEETTRQLNRNIQGLLGKYIDISNRICYYDNVLKGYLTTNRTYDNVLDNIDAYDNYLNQLNFYGLNGSNAEAFLKVYYLNNTLLPDWNTFFFADKDIKNSEEYQEAEKAGGALAWGFNAQNRRIFLSRLYNDDFNKPIGVVSIEVPESKLYSLIQETNLQEKVILICDDNGMVVSTNNRSQLGTSIKDRSYFLKAKDLNSGIFDINEAGSFKVISESLNKGEALPKWTIITLIPLDTTLIDAHKIRNTSLIFCVLILFVSTLLFTLFLGRITNRIKKLEQKMKKVKDGQFATLKDVGANDEIGAMIENFNLMVTSLKQLIYENYEVKIQMTDIALKKREAELYALQSQINPHFLFNTLESIRMKIYNGEDIQEASSMIFNLSKILRISLNWQGEIITLSKEIDFIKYYLEINKGRYKDKLKYTISIPDELSECKILKLVVQPIVENAIKHGLEQKSRHGMITISASEAEDRLIIEICDNGAGMDITKLEKIQREISTTENLKSEGSIGIKNVNDRIVLYYGKEFGLKIHSVQNEGTRVKLLLPKVK